jgi:hypothetical protein
MPTDDVNDDLDAEQLAILRRLSPEEKLRAMMRLYWSARQLKEAGLRFAQPELSDEQIKKLVNESFLYARD